MMGQQARSEALFYYFRLEDQIPETHLLRLIDKHISFEFVRQRLKDSYSGTGRPSIDPELLPRILLIGYLYGITSERKLVEELRMLWRGAGSPGWGSIRRFRITPRSRKTGTDAFGRRNCSSSCLRRSCGSVWKWDWYRARIYRSMAVLWKPTRRKKAAFHGSNWGKRPRFITPCASI